MAVGTKFQRKLTILICCIKFGRKGYLRSEQKNHIFAYVYGCYLLYKTFPHWSRQTQRHFNVSFPSSRRKNKLFDCINYRK